jgi:hypothetical protein
MCSPYTRTGREGSALAALVQRLLQVSRQITMVIAASALGAVACSPMTATIPGPPDDVAPVDAAYPSSCYNALPPGPC